MCINFVYNWVTDLNCTSKLWIKSILCFSTYMLYATLFSVVVFAELLENKFIVYIHSDVGTLVLLLPLYVPIDLPFLIYLHIYNYRHIFHYICYCPQYYYPKLFLPSYPVIDCRCLHLFRCGNIYLSTSPSLENFWQHICSASLLITFLFKGGKCVYKMTILPCVPVYLCPHVSGLQPVD